MIIKAETAVLKIEAGICFVAGTMTADGIDYWILNDERRQAVDHVARDDAPALDLITKTAPGAGGRREGAGRPRGDREPREAVSVRLEAADATRFRAICAAAKISQSAQVSKWISQEIKTKTKE